MHIIVYLNFWTDKEYHYVKIFRWATEFEDIEAWSETFNQKLINLRYIVCFLTEWSETCNKFPLSRGHCWHGLYNKFLLTRSFVQSNREMSKELPFLLRCLGLLLFVRIYSLSLEIDCQFSSHHLNGLPCGFRCVFFSQHSFCCLPASIMSAPILVFITNALYTTFWHIFY